MKQLSKKKKMQMESEHTKSKSGQAKIVKQHENEYGKGYYPALKKMEKKLMKKESTTKKKVK